MTDDKLTLVDDESPATPQSNEPEADVDYLEEDNDPMLEGLKEAEEELAQVTGNKSDEDQEDEPETDEQDDDEPKGKSEEGSEGKGKDDDKKSTENLMIPKARLDEALSRGDTFKDQAAYWRGVAEARAGQQAQPKQEQQPEGKQEEPENVVDEIDSSIEAAEKRKLELAEKYDEGEISTRQWKEQELEIDKEIRQLSKQRLDQIREESKKDTEQALTAAQQKNLIESRALEIQQQHPNVAVIDSYPEHLRQAIWTEITEQAVQNLAQRGINVNDGSPQSRLELIREKAALTDNYTPDNLASALGGGKTSQGKQADSHTGQGKSDVAKNREQKIELAESQPPSIAGMGRSEQSGELTEADIEKMSEDQLADMWERAPQRLQKLLGNSN